MGDIRNVLSNNVRYVLKSNVLLESLYLDREPIGWDDDDFKLERHEEYHGMFYTYTSSLSFVDEALDYIENSYAIGGVNTNLYLRKEIRKDIDGEVKWVVRYIVLADYKTRGKKNQQLTINFNSLELEELIKSHESDEFEIELGESIDGDALDDLEINKMTLEGRELLLSGEVVNLKDSGESMIYNFQDINYMQGTLIGKLISTSIDVFSNPIKFSGTHNGTTFGGMNLDAGSFFLQRETEDNGDRIIELRYDINIYGRSYDDGTLDNPLNFMLQILKYTWDSENDEYVVEDTPIDDERILVNDLASTTGNKHIVKGTITINKKYNEAYGIFVSGQRMYAEVSKFNLITSEKSFFERSVNIKFVFTHDLIDRLIYIITGKKESFYSKLLGRTDIVNSDGNQVYSIDGEFGLVGNISGLWARGFDRESEKYKSLTISIKNILSSLKTVANSGVGVESINFKERLRVEKLSYFYQDLTVVKFPYQVTNVDRQTDDSLFFSGLTIGYQYGGDYENDLGLDEPNTTSNAITPIRKSSNKYETTSLVRSDDYGLEETRRKPQSLYPTEDTSRDGSIWWLDLKRDENGGIGFFQKTWRDRLSKKPTGIFSPDTFYGMFFTPRVLMKRHSWVFTSGMMPYLLKKIKHISAKANDTLSMLFKDESVELSESSDVYVRDLDRPRLLPETITCNHPIDEDLMDWIKGTTRVEVEGSYEEVPNYYFKMEIINEDGDKEKVYLLSCDPIDEGTLVFQKAYEGQSDGASSINTIIEGAGIQFKTAKDIVNQISGDNLTLTESDIFNFKLVGDDIHFYVIKKYTLKDNAFKWNENIKSYLDLDSKMESVGHGSFLWAPNIKEIQLNGVLDISGSSFQTNGLENISLPNCTTHLLTSSVGAFYYNSNLKEVSLPVITNLVPSTFNRCSNIELINIPLCTDLGDPAVDNNIFYLVNPDCVINIHNSMETINNGNPDADLVYAENRGITINYI